MNEEIKDAAITLLQTLINATDCEPEDEKLAIDIIAKTMQEVVNENNLLQRVSNRRELLIAYGEWIHELAGCKDTEKATTLADSYLSNL